MKKKKFIPKASWKTSFMVFAYAIILFICFLTQTLLLVSIQYGWKWSEFLNPNFRLPIDNLTLIWTIVCAAYIGVDRAAYCVRSAEMISGESDIGDPSTLRVVIILSVFFFFFAVACNLFIDTNYDLTTLSTAVGSSMTLYIAGQKAITLCKNIDGKKKTEPSDGSIDSEILK